MQSQPGNMPKEKSATPELHDWQSALGAAVVLTLLISIGLIAANGWAWFTKMLETSAPAWVQAIGSVGAIVAAAAIARRQVVTARQLEARKQAAADIQKLRVIMALMARAHGLSTDITKAFETKAFEDFDQVSPELMVDTHLTLIRLPIFEIPEGLLGLDVLTIGRALGVMREHWQEVRNAAEAQDSSLETRIGNTDTLAREIGEISLAAVNDCKKHIAAREAVINAS
jgi:hypothetical protein